MLHTGTRCCVCHTVFHPEIFVKGGGAKNDFKINFCAGPWAVVGNRQSKEGFG